MYYKFTKITCSSPWLLNNASTAEELIIALEDYMRTGTQIIFQHDGDDCILTSFEYKTDENNIIAYFVTPKKKLLKVDTDAGWNLVVTESDLGAQTPDLSGYATKTYVDGELNKKANSTDLNSYATKTYVDNAVAKSGGGGGGGSCIIDVSELPTTGINKNAIYRVSGEAQMYVPVEEMGIFVPLSMMLEGAPVSYTVVDTLPDPLPPSNIETMELNVYIVSSTGIGYMDVGMGAMTVGTVVFGAPEADRGWCDDINSLVLSEATFGLWATKGASKLYVYQDGKWVEIRNGAITIPIHYSISAGNYQLSDSEIDIIKNNFENTVIKIDFPELGGDAFFLLHPSGKGDGEFTYGSAGAQGVNSFMVNGAWIKNDGTGQWGLAYYSKVF